MLTLYIYYGPYLLVNEKMTIAKSMKTLLFAATLLLSACTFYVQQPLPSDAAFWNQPVTQRGFMDPPQAPRIPQWCVDPISRTNIPC